MSSELKGMKYEDVKNLKRIQIKNEKFSWWDRFTLWLWLKTFVFAIKLKLRYGTKEGD